MNKGLYVIMGVTGSGKSLIGAALARELAVEFVEGDAYHSAANVERMKSGIPLTDEDREGWLRAIASRIGEARDAGTGLVVSCSALKRSYRDILRGENSDIRFVFLRGPRALIAERLSKRQGHFMPPALLDSQFAALQKPSPEEDAWICDIADSPADIVAEIVDRASA